MYDVTTIIFMDKRRHARTAASAYIRPLGGSWGTGATAAVAIRRRRFSANIRFRGRSRAAVVCNGIDIIIRYSGGAPTPAVRAVKNIRVTVASVCATRLRYGRSTGYD